MGREEKKKGGIDDVICRDGKSSQHGTDPNTGRSENRPKDVAKTRRDVRRGAVMDSGCCFFYFKIYYHYIVI